MVLYGDLCNHDLAVSLGSSKPYKELDLNELGSSLPCDVHFYRTSTNATAYSSGFISAGNILGVGKEGWTVGNAVVSNLSQSRFSCRVASLTSFPPLSTSS